MPLRKLTFRPGFNTQTSSTGNEGGWSDGSLVRFRDGLPEKWRGWVQANATALTGVPRSVLAWQQLDGNVDVAFGTHERLALLQGGALYDITPTDRTSTRTDPITTVGGSNIVKITDASFGASTGDLVYISGMSAVGGIASLNGPQTIYATEGSSLYYILAPTAATSSTIGGGTITFTYQIARGPVDSAPSNGVGVGLAGDGTVGTPRAGAAVTIGVRIWSLANFGEVLLASPRDGGLYAWLPANGTNSQAALVTNGTAAYGPPLRIGRMLMGMPERHVVLLGASSLNSSSSYDPMLVRFSDVEDYTNYYATATNSAGSFRLEGGTKLIGGLVGVGQILIWSDLCLFAMTFVGAPYYYRFDRLGMNCGLIGPNACAAYGGVTYWMNSSGFFRFVGGAPQPIPCPIYRTVFENVSDTQGDKTFCGVNTVTDEVIWFYQSASGSDVDSYAAYCTTAGTWTFGSLARTTYIDSSNYMPPIATAPDGTIYYHESGDSANGTGMDASITSGYFDIGDGTEYTTIDQVIPDFVEQVGNVQMTILATDTPNAAPRMHGPYTLTPSTKFKTVRVRARQVAFKFESSDVNAYWRLGAVRVNAIPDGRNG